MHSCLTIWENNNGNNLKVNAKPLGINSDNSFKFMKEGTLLLLPNFTFLLVTHINGFKTVVSFLKVKEINVALQSL